MSTALSSSINTDQPWPGLAPFLEADSSFFHGRSQASFDLDRLVNTSTASVLFGQSGLGKTSLIQAGLFPQLRLEDFLPVYVRLDHSQTAPPLTQQLLLALEQECLEKKIEYPQRTADDCLWSYFHRRGADFWLDGIRLITPLIVIDQFEEIFSLGKESALQRERAVKLVEGLAELVENYPPERIRQQIEVDPAISREYDFSRANFRLLISLREDFLPAFEELMPKLPSLRSNRLRLLPMNGNEALQAVEQSGANLVTQGVGEQIVRFVAADAKDRPLKDLAVEPSILSLVCSELNRRRQSSGLAHISIDLLKGAREEILNDFYMRCMSTFPLPVYEFIEDKLLSEDGYRNNFVEQDALRLLGISKEIIDKLVDLRLIRREERYGVMRIELTHDRLTQVVKGSRDKRRLNKELEDSKIMLERQRKRQYWLSVSIGVMLVALISVSLLWKKASEAEYLSRNNAKKARLAEENVSKEARKAKEAEIEANNQAKIAKEAEIEAKNQAKKAEEAEAKANALAKKAQDRLEDYENERKRSSLLEIEGIASKKENEKLRQEREAIDNFFGADKTKEALKPLTEKQQRIVNKSTAYLAKYKILDEIKAQYSELVTLIANTESMDDNEKQYWFDIMPSMTDSQIRGLFEILETERKKLEALEIKYQQEIAALNKKHTREFLNDSIIRFNKSKKESDRKDIITSASYVYKNTDTNLVDERVQLLETILKYANKYDELQFDVINQQLASAYNKQGKSDKAYTYTLERLKIIEQRYAKKEFDRKKYEERMAGACLVASWYALILKKYDKAIYYANYGLKIAPTDLALETNLAHGLLFSGHAHEAMDIYKRNFGKKVNDEQTWQQVILEDFAALRKAGITNPKMKDVEQLMR